MPLQIALLGAGLHNLLLAHLLCRDNKASQVEGTCPLRVVVFDVREAVDTNKFISCHDSDVPPPWRKILEPFWLRSWPAYRVRFPSVDQGSSPSGLASRPVSAHGLPFQNIDIGYHTLDLERLTAAVPSDPAQGGVEWRLGQRVSEVDLQDFDLVVDSRTDHSNSRCSAGVQQFLGRVMQLEAPHGVDLPVIMDAAVRQFQGFCFVYLLPLDDRRILIEATRLLPEAQPWTLLEEALEDYCRSHEWQAHSGSWEREERGLIPIPWVGVRQWQKTESQKPSSLEGVRARAWHWGLDAAGRQPVVLPVGAAHGFFHPTTGYSLPIALRSCLSLHKTIETLRVATPAGRAAKAPPPPCLAPQVPELEV